MTKEIYMLILQSMKDFKKYYIIPATPEEVYAALTNKYTIQLWSGDVAVMSTDVDTEFSLWNGDIVGKNLKFEPNKLIQQQWYFGEQEIASIVTIKVHEHKQGTSLEIQHSNIPDEDFENICDGWEYNYVGSIIDFYTE